MVADLNNVSRMMTMMIIIMMLMKMSITLPIFKLGPPNFAWEQIQTIPTNDDNEDDDNDNGDDDNEDDNYDDHEDDDEKQNGHN